MYSLATPSRHPQPIRPVLGIDGKVRSYASYDPVLGRTFVAPTAEALLRYFNDPATVAWRAWMAAHVRELAERNEKHKHEALARAEAKRMRKRQRNLINQHHQRELAPA